MAGCYCRICKETPANKFTVSTKKVMIVSTVLLTTLPSLPDVSCLLFVVFACKCILRRGPLLSRVDFEGANTLKLTLGCHVFSTQYVQQQPTREGTSQ